MTEDAGVLEESGGIIKVEVEKIRDENYVLCGNWGISGRCETCSVNPWMNQFKCRKYSPAVFGLYRFTLHFSNGGRRIENRLILRHYVNQNAGEIAAEHAGAFKRTHNGEDYADRSTLSSMIRQSYGILKRFM